MTQSDKDARDHAEAFAEIMKFLRDKLSDRQVSAEIVREIRKICEYHQSQYETKQEEFREAKMGANDHSINRSAVQEMQAIETAKAECRPYLDNPGMAFDSAASVYSTALRRIGVAASDCRATPAANLRSIFLTMRDIQTPGAKLAADSTLVRSARERFLHEFPGAAIPRRA